MERKYVVAPMAGGPSTPELVAAVSEAGGAGFLAGGYLSGQQLGEDIESLRSLTDAPFGVNLFVPEEPQVTDEVHAYHSLLRQEFPQLEIPEPYPNDDRFAEKLEVAIELGVPVISFTFGFPDGEVVARLKRSGIGVFATVATAEDARVAASGGAEAIICQGPKAGGHRAMFDQTAPEPGLSLAELLGAVRPLGLPMIAAGGISTREDALAALNAGADAVAAGTLFLCAEEAGTNVPYRQALLAGRRDTELTRAYSGRLARGLVTEFMTRHAKAPACYPCINAMTKPIRGAATARGDADRMSLWAGQDYVVAEESASRLLERLRG